jgi:molybdopterin-guanine dinucleotide biosynthesis protein A
VRVLAEVADDVVVAGLPEGVDLPAGVRSVADTIPDAGPLAGLLAGLSAIGHECAVVVATDLPHLDAAVLSALLEKAAGVDAVVPRVAGHPQPTHAVYATSVVPAAARRLFAGRCSLRGLLDDLRVGWVEEDELRSIDPELRSFVNVNTPEEWEAVSRGIDDAGRQAGRRRG